MIIVKMDKKAEILIYLALRLYENSSAGSEEEICSFYLTELSELIQTGCYLQLKFG